VPSVHLDKLESYLPFPRPAKMESHILKVSVALTAYIQALTGQSVWWYGVDIDPAAPSSLFCLLGIDPDDYPSFLESQGFTTNRGFSGNKISSFVQATGDISYSRQQWKGSKKHYYLRVGITFKTKQLDDFKVSMQLALVGDEAKPPRIIRAAIFLFR
jgi:hypothetical protein